MRRQLGQLRVYGRRIRSQSVIRTVREVSHPGKLARHAQRLLQGDISHSNSYTPSLSTGSEAEFVARLIGCDRAQVDRAFIELAADASFLADLEGRYRQVRPDSSFHIGRFQILYAAVRLRAPRTVLETGVHDGLSAAVMLRALERNQSGRLISIDLPSTDLPAGVSGPGWLVHEALRARWHLMLGDARELLPSLAAAHAPVDLFIHDSDHSAAHQEFEFRTVRPHLAPTGLIISDQDYPSDPLESLSTEWNLSHERVRVRAGQPGGFMGGLRPSLLLTWTQLEPVAQVHGTFSL